VVIIIAWYIWCKIIIIIATVQKAKPKEHTSTEKEKTKQGNISTIVIAISHPDQWGFWEWLGQTPRLV
jgi:hypothetical protein